MTASNIPDSFSPEALQELLENAPTDIVDREVDDETCSSCELSERVTAALEAFEEVAEDPQEYFVKDTSSHASRTFCSCVGVTF